MAETRAKPTVAEMGLRESREDRWQPGFVERASILNNRNIGGSAAKRRLYETASILADGAVDCEGRKVIE